MLWANINRDKKEWSFGVFYNTQAVTVSKGDWVVFDVATTADGNRTGQAGANTLTAVVGVAIEDVAATDYGRFQTYGYCAQALVKGISASDTAAGDVLGAVASADHVIKVADGATGSALAVAVFCGATLASSTTPAAAALKPVIVKTL